MQFRSVVDQLLKESHSHSHSTEVEKTSSVEESEHRGSMEVTVLRSNIIEEDGGSMYKIKRKPLITEKGNPESGRPW